MPNGFIPNQTTNTGLFVGTTDVWEVSRLQDIDVNSQEFKLLLTRLYQNINSISLALNLKESAYYLNTPFVTGKVFFPTPGTNQNNLRQDQRMVFNIGALPPGVTTVPHGLPIINLTGGPPVTTWTGTRLYGTATDTTTPQFYSIPFAGAGGTYISVIPNGTNVVIDNGTAVTFQQCIIVFEYLTN
jgi:hypothetical protein